MSDKSAAHSKAGVKTGSSVKAIRNSKKPTEDDPWVEYLGEVAMTDSDYITMVHHLEAGTEIKDIDKECELSKCHNYKDKLSVTTLKGGQTLILRDNEILVPSKERKNMLNLAHATNHRGHDGMLQQMRGRIFWEGMNKEAKDLVNTCDPCQINARSHKQDKTEISHKNMFNLHPNHTIHVDYCVYGGHDYIVLVDRVTGYIMAEQTANQGTDAAISVIRNWGLLFGNPMRVISDDGGGFRNDFKEKLKCLIGKNFQNAKQ